MSLGMSPEDEEALRANGCEAQRLQTRLEAIRAAKPELFPGITKFNVEGCCKLNGTEERTAVAVWAVVHSESWRSSEGCQSQNAAFTFINNNAAENSATWLEAARMLSGNFADRQGHAMVFARSTDLEEAIKRLETEPLIHVSDLNSNRGLPDINNPKPNWVEIMRRFGNASAGKDVKR